LKALSLSGTAAATSALLPRSAAGFVHSSKPSVHSVLDPAIIIDRTDVHALAMRTLDAAKAGGADYTDVRLTRLLLQEFQGGEMLGDSPFLHEDEFLGIGVRARIQGVWGFAASPYWNADDAVRLAEEAVRQAKTNLRASPQSVDWPPIPVASGAWSTPIKVDPFVLSIEEKSDYLLSGTLLAARYRINNSCRFTAKFTREERVVATSEGAYFTQTLYQTGADFHYYRENVRKPKQVGSAHRTLPTTAAGWELLTDAKINEQIPLMYMEADPNLLRKLPPEKPGEIGRYDVVFDAATMGSLVEQTIGKASQLDRALGYEANTVGTSYLSPDPLAFLGTYQAAAPLINVTANRSMSRGLATVKWDDEGVTPEDFSLVRDGVLVDYQTTREQARWLAPWYEKQGSAVRSHGCAAAESALFITMQQMPNLVLEPGTHEVGFADLVADTKQGLAVMKGSAATDFQAGNGTIHGVIREITNGRLGPVLTGLECLFNTTQLWKSIAVLGGRASTEQYPAQTEKGEPLQTTSFSVRAVPAKIAGVDFIDPRRRA
jgi:TldD protein